MCALSNGLNSSCGYLSLVRLSHLRVSTFGLCVYALIGETCFNQFRCLCFLYRHWEMILWTGFFCLSGWDSCISFDPYFMKWVSQNLLIAVQATAPECWRAEMLFHSPCLCCWTRLKENFSVWLVLYFFIINSKQTVS